MKMLQE